MRGEDKGIFGCTVPETMTFGFHSVFTRMLATVKTERHYVLADDGCGSTFITDI